MNYPPQTLDDVVFDHGEAFDNAVIRLEEEALEEARETDTGPAEFLPVGVPLDGWWEVEQ